MYGSWFGKLDGGMSWLKFVRIVVIQNAVSTTTFIKGETGIIRCL
jgi:hypothetical protein